MTGLAVASTVMGGVSMIGGLTQASKQRKAAAQAEAQSRKLMSEAKALATKNYFEKIQIPTQAYERQFRENTAQQMQNVQSLQEAGGRSLAAGIGKVAGQGTQGNQIIADKMAQDLYENQVLKAEAARDVNNDLIDINVGAATDESLRARDARTLGNQSMGQAIKGMQAGLKGASDLFGEGGYLSGGQAGRTFRKLTPEQKKSFINSRGVQMSDDEIKIELSKIKDKDVFKNIRDGNYDMKNFSYGNTSGVTFGGTGANTLTTPPAVTGNPLGNFQSLSPNTQQGNFQSLSPNAQQSFINPIQLDPLLFPQSASNFN